MCSKGVLKQPQTFVKDNRAKSWGFFKQFSRNIVNSPGPVWGDEFSSLDTPKNETAGNLKKT